MYRTSLCSIGRTLAKQFHTSNCLKIDPKNVEQVKIPVPWGHIAGEWWGSRDKEPIFALHGWQDNARTWEPFLRLLPEDMAVLAFDFPGNGLSSHYPPFLNYSFIDSVYILRRLQKYYGLKDIVVLGHSGGSATGFLYSAIFPDSVRGYFGIDFLLYAYGNDGKRADKMIKTVDQKIKLGLRRHDSSPTYEWDTAKKAIVKATRGSVNPKTAEILMQRGMSRRPDDQYVYTRDGRVKSPALESVSVKQAECLASNITAHVRLVKGSKSKFFEGGIKNCPQVLDIINSKAKSYELHTVEGMWYGDKNTTPLIALHGMQDNAASWVPIVPMLDVSSLLCLDLPGHGMSSHLAPGMTLHYLDNILFLRYLLNRHFQFGSDLTLLGHSFGASLWFVYSALFPAEVSKFVSIESALFNMMREPEKIVDDTRKTIESYIELEGKTREPQTYEDLLNYMYISRQRNFPVSLEKCKTLLTRGVRPVGDKFTFSVDPRLNVRYLGNLTSDFILELSSRLKCKVLNIRAEDGIPTGKAKKLCDRSLDILKKSNRHVLDIFVPGGHHVHLEQPENVAPVINKFLTDI